MSAVQWMPFGKYCGQSLWDVPARYLAWLSSQDWLEEPLASSIEAELDRRRHGGDERPKPKPEPKPRPKKRKKSKKQRGKPQEEELPKDGLNVRVGVLESEVRYLKAQIARLEQKLNRPCPGCAEGERTRELQAS